VSHSAFSSFHRRRDILLDLSMSFSITPGIARCSVNAGSDLEDSLLLGDDLNLLLDGEGSLLSVDHNLEALEVGEGSTEVSLSELFSDGHLGPLGVKIGLLACLDEGTSAGSTLN